MTKKKNKNKKKLWEDSSQLINLKKQLAFLRDNKRKIKENKDLYYHEEQNQIDILHYYQSVINPESEDVHLFESYHVLLKKTHKNCLPYFLSKDLYLYPWVDLHPDGLVKSIYSGDEKNPESLIIQDYETINQRYIEFQQYLQNVKNKEYEPIKQLKSIEDKLKLNTEHIVPQSWFGGLEPMKGDLHHLFICEPGCNITRSNFPFVDFPFYIPESPEEVIHNHCGVATDYRFEPEHGKGTIARAMLYFLLRYPKVIKKPFRTQIDIPLLVKWHQEFPVTLYEKHRNQAIYRIQGNRNPFIDFPNLPERMQFQIT
jgi:deoxyribonuclease I